MELHVVLPNIGFLTLDDTMLIGEEVCIGMASILASKCGGCGAFATSDKADIPSSRKY